MTALLLPLIASIIQPLGFLLIKKGTDKPLQALYAALITNIFFGLFSFPFLVITPKSGWFLPSLAALLSDLGQLLLFLSVIGSDVSVITPVMGTKVLFIALLDWFFASHKFDPKLALSIFFSILGFFLLNKPTSKKILLNSVENNKGLFFAVGCSLLFACSDLIIQKASHEPFLPFLLRLYVLCAVFSLPFLSFFSLFWKQPSFFPIPLISGSLIQGFQGLIVALGILFSANAAQTNILYNLRGIWSVLIVWTLGFLFKTEDSVQQKGVFFNRVVAALSFLISAVFALL
ncbi:hypothetical protein [Methylacidiphilum caldifontis]|uniref:EamA domain-containing protein n=1 Tax=Methylacidiphilum caldifontis TaxID=2795386 RepID=A0A4Y8PGC4_9BACT|nr:hypothetical protein [Methylacidiphilum caldifontis]QSR89372.1 hypothetical protein IT6_03580 [Methylacidiphilum caldifontis]TFE71076.1 hypothetical protein A7Q10_05525 [Methylacidiphilum caldifontis]